jgi:hypothetical protein
MATYRDGGSQRARSGAALALRACAQHLSGQLVPAALDFLLGQGLADMDEGVRGQMVAAGALKPSHSRKSGHWFSADSLLCSVLVAESSSSGRVEAMRVGFMWQAWQ